MKKDKKTKEKVVSKMKKNGDSNKKRRKKNERNAKVLGKIWKQNAKAKKCEIEKKSLNYNIKSWERKVYHFEIDNSFKVISATGYESIKNWKLYGFTQPGDSGEIREFSSKSLFKKLINKWLKIKRPRQHTFHFKRCK